MTLERAERPGHPAEAPRSGAVGVLLVGLSGVSFAAATVMGKLAFRGGAQVGAVVTSRLVVGAAVLWGAAALLRPPLAIPRSRRPGIALLGALSTAVGLLLFAAVRRIPASTTTLLLYAYPAIVATITVALGRDRLSTAKLGTLALGLSGVVLVLGFPVGSLDAVGAGLALGAAVALSLYIVAAQKGAAGLHPLVAGAAVLTTAAILYLPIAPAQGGLGAGSGWGWVALVGVATGAGLSLFLAGLERLGPIRASIGSTIEPVAAVLLGSAALAERLTPVQLLGGVLVLAAVVLLPLTRR